MTPPLPMHPDVAAVERIFEAAGGPGRNARTLRMNRPAAEHALSLCPCMIAEELDTPSWLLFTEADGALAWCRIPDRLGQKDLVRARRSKGGHTDMDQVMGWLLGACPEPWPAEDAWGDPESVPVLTALIRRHWPDGFAGGRNDPDASPLGGQDGGRNG